MQKARIAAQKRNNRYEAFEFDVIRLDPDFPVQVGHDCATAGDARSGLFHFHRELEIGLCLQGRGVFDIEGRKFRFNAGDMIVIGPGLMHTAVSDRGLASHWVWMFIDPPGLLGGRVDDTGILDAAPYASLSSPVMHLSRQEHPRLYACLSEVAGETASPSPSRDLLRALFTTALTYLYRLTIARDAGKASVASSGVGRIVPALKLVNARFRESLTVKDLASACCMSERNFTSVFERSMHETPYAYVTRFRISQSCGALAGSQRTISEIALACGFDSLSSFNRNFRAAMGATPQEFRRRASGRR